VATAFLEGNTVMISVRYKRYAAVPAWICLASGFFLLLAAGPIAPPASAQSAGEEKLRSALLGLRNEFPETLVKITPQLLRLQKELVENLRIQLAGVREGEKVRQQSIEEVVEAQLAYLKELEALRVMDARSGNASASEKDLLKIRIEVRTEALSYLKKLSQSVEERVKVGNVTTSDVAAARASALKAEIMLEALKAAAE
jgi:hypothetical protein